MPFLPDFGAVDAEDFCGAGAADDAGLLGRVKDGADFAVADRGSNLGALKPFEVTAAGCGSTLCLLTGAAPTLGPEVEVAAGASTDAAGRAARAATTASAALSEAPAPF